MNNLEKNIKTAEDKWLNPLFNYCKLLFEKVNIPSHDHSHHVRVWEYSKEILKAIQFKDVVNYDLVESCLISSFFHDTGLTINLNENHGSESKKLCLEYFEKNHIIKPKNFDKILYAIENHDDKDYKNNNHDPNSVLSIICNADDLDAFGNIGVVRYTEIYLLRGINLKDLPSSVIKNLDTRFYNFKRTYKSFTELYEKYKNRYLISRSFFENVMNEL